MSLPDLLKAPAVALSWKPNYSTGVDQLDEQHRRLFALFNRLEWVTRADPYDPSEARCVIREIGSVLTEHFTCEEACMDRAGCLMADKNRQEHEALRRLYLDFADKYHKTPSTAAIEAFHNQAEQWLLEHVCFVDIHLRRCVYRPGGGG